MGDPRWPNLTFGKEIGSPAMTTRGLVESDFIRICTFIDKAINIAKEVSKGISSKSNGFVGICQEYNILFIVSIINRYKIERLQRDGGRRLKTSTANGSEKGSHPVFHQFPRHRLASTRQLPSQHPITTS